jgi:hypothetical protein
MGLRGEGRRGVVASESRRPGVKYILKTEHQTVDHRNKFMGNDPDSIFVRFRTECSTRTNKL